MVAYNDWEEEQIARFNSNFGKFEITSEEVCRWCIEHRIQYQIMYPLDKFEWIKNPVKYLKYQDLKSRVNRYAENRLIGK